MATLANNTPTRQSVSLGTVFKAAAIGAGIAAVVNLVLLVIANLFGVQLNVMAGPPGPNAQAMTIGPVEVVLFSVLPAIIGAVLYWALTKVSARAATIFTVIAVIVLVLSLFPVFGQPLGPGGAIVLILMHLAAAAAITWALTTRARA